MDIHFIHVRSRHENALPVIITHGWPGSIVEMLNVIGPLSDPTAHGGEARTPSTSSFRRFRLRVLRQADRHRMGARQDRGRLVRADEANRV